MYQILKTHYGTRNVISMHQHLLLCKELHNTKRKTGKRNTQTKNTTSRQNWEVLQCHKQRTTSSMLAGVQSRTRTTGWRAPSDSDDVDVIW